MKKQLLLFLLLLLPMVAVADAVEIDGIYYNLFPETNVAEVTKHPSGDYSGAVNIPDSVECDSVAYCVKSIEEKAFYGCGSLTSVTIPKSVTSIGFCAFADCSGIASMVVEKGNKIYDSRDSCNAVIITETNELVCGCKATVIPNSVTAVGNYAFSGCGGLTSIDISDGVTLIGSYAFSGCGGLVSVTIPESVVFIGESAFADCVSLSVVTSEMLTLPSVTGKIFSESAYGTVRLIVPVGMKGKLTWTEWAKFANITEKKTATQLELDNALAKMEEKIQEMSKLEEEVLAYQQKMTEELGNKYSDIKSTAKDIGTECVNVRKCVAISEYEDKEYLYSELKEIEASSESIITQVDYRMAVYDEIIHDQETLRSVYDETIGMIRRVMDGAERASDLDGADIFFEYLEKTFSDTKSRLEHMSDKAESDLLTNGNKNNRTRLDNVKAKLFPNKKTLPIVTNSDFVYFPIVGNLVSIFVINREIGPGCKMPYNISYKQREYIITEVEPYGFANCNNLDWVSLNDGVTILHEGAFKDCNSMTSIDLSKDLKTIERYALAFPNLRNIILPAGNTNFTKIGDHLYSADKSVLVRILSTTSGEYTLPDGLTDIVGGAFYGCTSLTSIITNQKMPPALTDEDAFDGLDFSKCKLSVPAGSSGLYRAAKGWDKFLIIEERHSNEDEPVTIMANSYTREYGEENPSFEFTSEGAPLDGNPVVTCQATSDSEAGVYPIIIQKGTVRNYNDTYINGTLTITKATLKVSVEDAEREYGEPNPTFEIVYDGWKLNDTPDKLMEKPSALCLADEESPAGEYAIELSGGMDSCYDFEYTNGKLTVKWGAGIDGLTVDDGCEFDIYSTTGQTVKRKATSLKGLRPGIYIVGGKKVYVK
jgi:hypothetical protein